MAGYTSKPIAATALISNGTANGAVAIADVTGWTIGSQVALSDSTTTSPVMATIVGIVTATNTLLLRTDRVPSAGWAQLDWPANSLGQGLPPQLGTNDSKNPTDMSAWTTANTAKVAQIPTFVYSTLVKKAKAVVSHFFTLNSSLLSNSRTTPAFQDTLGDGTQMLLLTPHQTRIEPNGFLNENAAINYLSYSQLIGFNDGTNGWTNSSTTVTINSLDVLAPDGTQTTSKIVVPISTGSSQNMTWQISADSAAHNWSVWLRVLSGTQTVYIGTRVASSFVACTVTTTWQRFFVSNLTSAYFYIGYNGLETGGPGGPGYTVYAWGAQGEGLPTVPYYTSYFPTNTNTFINSGQLCGGGATTAGGATGTGTLNTTDVTDPFAGNSATKLVLSATSGGGVQYAFWNVGTPVAAGGTPSTGGITSIWARCATGTNSITIFDGSGAHTNVLSLTTTWQRFSVTNLNPDACYIGSYLTGIPGGTIYIFGIQNEYGTQPSSTFITGGSITTTRALDALTFSNPLYGIDPTNWSFGATLTPQATWAQLFLSTGNIASIWFQGGTQVTPNSYRAYGSATGLVADIWDVTNTVRTVNCAGTLSSNNPVTVQVIDANGQLSMTPGSPVVTGAGTGVISTQPATITLGYGSSLFNFQGWLKTVWMDKG